METVLRASHSHLDFNSRTSVTPYPGWSEAPSYHEVAVVSAAGTQSHTQFINEGGKVHLRIECIFPNWPTILGALRGELSLLFSTEGL